MSATLTNRFLFSHHYLERICQEAEDRAEATQLIADLRGWVGGWDDSSLSSMITSQVQPTLVSLGFNYQQPSDDDDPHLVRLYTSYRQENQVGLCYVAHREEGKTDLDSTIKGRHYAAEIIHALKEEELSWGLLTDGQRWRIYHADELAPYETFLEISLGQLLTDRDSAGRGDAALLLHTVFTKSAFEVDEDGECALDRYLSDSEKEASAIEKHLSTCIEDVLRDLCQGFVERDGRETYTVDQRDEVFRNATVLLYRLLFILYAEARDLLPLEVPEYHSASLDALVEQAAQYVKVTGLPDPDGTELWQDLSDLCSWVNSGDEDHHIPAYNGDLFDDSDKRYIHDHTIADKYLAPALFSLGAIEDDSQTGYRRIDYRDLSVRHLGSIYEGLLEYKLFITQVERVRRADGKGGYAFPELSKTRLKKGEEDQVIGVGEVYFADSAGERKATGTYYTPEYIVDYIVQQTVRRGLEERRTSLEEQLTSWLEEVETAPPGERQRLQKVVDQKLLDFVEQEVLTFSVCDPAMGSGHFLVNAVHTITTFIVETLNLTPWENAEIDSDPVTWRRKVVKRCLYGVDLNPLAVELAKLSLWLTTAAEGRPLSFLDHHLRQGNSLIGARLGDLIRALNESASQDQERLATGQMSMFDSRPEFRAPLREAVDLVLRISSRIADAAEDVESQAAVYEELRRELKPYRDVADLVTAQDFGMGVDQDELRIIAHCVLEDRSVLSEDHQALLRQAQELAQNQSFFHWDLEFPEAFIDLKRTTGGEGGGFCAVVGNPPWGGEIKPFEQSYYYSAYPETTRGSLDTYKLFIQRGQDLCNRTASLGFIVPNTFMTQTTYVDLRSFILGQSHLAAVVNLGDGVFAEATAPSCILCLSAAEVGHVRYLNLKAMDPRHKEQHIRDRHHTTSSLPFRQLPDRIFILEPKAVLQVLTRLLRTFQLLGNSSRYEVRDVGINYNRSSVSKKVFYTGAKSDPRDLPRIKGSSFNRYTGVRRAGWLRHNYSDLLTENESINVCEQVYELPEKLIFRQTADTLIATIDTSRMYLGRSVIAVTREGRASLGYLLALLNSRTLAWLYDLIAQEEGRVLAQVKVSKVESLPIPAVVFHESVRNRRDLLRKVISNYASRSIGTVLAQVSKCLDAQPKRTDIVHDVLNYLAEEMIRLHEKRRELEKAADIFRYVDTSQPFVRLDEALVLSDSQRTAGPMDLAIVHHDIDGLRLVREDDVIWTLELQAKFRDPDQGWQDWIKEEDGHMIKRRWAPAHRLQLSEEKARFYRYALPRLQDFENAGSFPGGYTRSTLKKLHLTKVPMMPDVDLSELACLDCELSETKRKIELTDDLIDQIVYKLYGLTEEEIAIVENQT